MGLPMADEDSNKNNQSDNITNPTSDHQVSGINVDDVRNNDFRISLESNRRNSLPPVLPNNVDVRLCGQILRLMGDEHFSKTCGRHLRCMGDEMCSFYWVRQQMLKKEQPPRRMMSNSHSLPDLTHPQKDKS